MSFGGIRRRDVGRAPPLTRPASLRYAGRPLPALAGEVKTAPPARRRRASAPAPANSRTPSGSPSSAPDDSTPTTGTISVPIEAVEAGRRCSAANQHT